MTWYANRLRDDQILSLIFDHGKSPKEVKLILQLNNVWVVYRVVATHRKKFRVEPKRQIPPIPRLDSRGSTA
jgi:hypothetical protein